MAFIYGIGQSHMKSMVQNCDDLETYPYRGPVGELALACKPRCVGEPCAGPFACMRSAQQCLHDACLAMPQTARIPGCWHCVIPS
eukprot:767621-Pelagomonas_calceolata.AAC.2